MPSPASRPPLVLSFALAVLIAFVFAPLPTRAATIYFWQGGGGNSNWLTAGNWQGDLVPPNSLTLTDLTFGNSAFTSPTNLIPYNIHSLTFASGASAYTLNTQTLTLGAGGISQNANVEETFSGPVVLGADQAWTLANGAGALVFNGGVNLTDSGGNARSLTINTGTTGDSGNEIDGVIRGAGSLLKTGAGTLILTGANTYAGTTLVNEGVLLIGTGSSMEGAGISIGGGTIHLAGSGSATLNTNAIVGVDGTDDQPGFFLLSDTASLSTGTLNIGINGSGTFSQTGGTLAAGVLNIAFGTTGNCSYLLSAGAMSTGAINIGNLGTATFRQQGGTIVNSGEIAVGASTRGSGTYLLSAGSLTSNIIYIGRDGTGVFTQSGGTVLALPDEIAGVPGIVALGYNFGSSGSYTLTNGSLTSEGLYIGHNGTGAFTQSGGAVVIDRHVVDDTIVPSLILGYAPGSSGSYTLNDGSLTSEAFYIGLQGMGVFTQNGGTVTSVSHTKSPNNVPIMALGADLGSHGYYILNHGDLAFEGINVGQLGVGNFVQNGGTVTGSTLSIQGSGSASGDISSYTLNDGVLTTYSGTDVYTVFTQNGGVNNALSIVIHADTSGIYNLNAGNLIVNFISGDGDAAGAGSVFNFNGGILQAEGSGPNFLTGLTLAYVKVGGAMIDTLSFDVTIHQDLLHDDGSGGGLSSSGTMAPAKDGGLTKLGSGKLTLTGANTYTGVTTISFGVLQIGDGGTSGSLGSGSVVNQSSLIFDRADNITVSNAISGSGVIIQAGTGTLFFTGSDTHLGGTDITAGTLAVIASGKIAGGNFSVLGGATLAISDQGSVSTDSSASLAIGGTDGSVAHVTIGDTGHLSAGSTQIGNGVFTQSGGFFSSNTVYLGYALGSSGSYVLSGTGNLSTGKFVVGYNGAGEFTQTGGVFSTNGETLFLGMAAGSAGTYTLFGGALRTGVTQIGTANNTGTFTQIGGTHITNVLQLTSDASGTGTYNLEGGILNAGTVTGSGIGSNGINSGGIGGGGAVPDGRSIFNFNGGTLQAGASSTSFFQNLSQANVQAGGARIDTNGFDVTIAQSLLHDNGSGAQPSGGGSPAVDGGLTKLGAGMLTLTGLNTFAGPLNIDAGTLAVATEANLGAASTVTVGGNGQLLFTATATLTRNYDLGGATLSTVPGSTLTLAGSTINGGFFGMGGITMLADGTTLNSTQAAAGATLVQTTGTATFHDVTLNGNSTFTQTPGGTLNSTGDFVTSSDSTVTLNDRVNIVGGHIAGALNINRNGSVNESGSATPLNLEGSRGTTVNAGGSLNAASGSTIELSGLLVNNGTQTGILNINRGGVAQGNGNFGAVNVSAGGEFNPGNSLGLVTVDSLSLDSGGTYSFQIFDATAAAGAGYDSIHSTGALMLNLGTAAKTQLLLNVSSLGLAAGRAIDFDPTKSYVFTLVSADGGITGFDARDFNIDTSGFHNDLAGGIFSVAQDGHNLDLVFIPTPEPGAAALLTMGGLATALTRRCRKRRRARLEPKFCARGGRSGFLNGAPIPVRRRSRPL